MTDNECLSMLGNALTFFRRYDFSAYGEALQTTRAAIFEQGDPPELLGEWLLLSSLCEFGNAKAQAATLNDAGPMLGRRSSVIPSGTPLLLDCGEPFATFWNTPGAADATAEDVAQLETLWMRLTGGGQGTTTLYRARLDYYRGELQSAFVLAKQARQQARDGAQQMNALMALELQGLLHRHHVGEGRDVFSVLRSYEESDDRAVSQMAQICHCNLYLSIGVLCETPSWIQHGDFGAVSHPDAPGWRIFGDKLAPPLLPAALLSRMQYLSYMGQYIEALELADCTQLVYRVCTPLVNIYLDFWRAGCFYALGDMQRYRECLSAVLERCAPDGLWLIPGEYEAGGNILSELALPYGEDAVRRMLSAGEGLLGRNERLRKAYLRGRMSETLTRREREVLEHVNSGSTNAQTAQLLGIGEETVKTHLKHAFDKLNIRSRSQISTAISRTKVASTPVWSVKEK